ncbi:MAG TPA: cytochrome b N-terminal domain-containing protein, partial [Polyangiaceae bacterium]
MSRLRDLGDWLDERTAWRASYRAWIDHPVVGGAPWASAIAASVATCFGVLALTGTALMTSYSPSPQAAWASVFFAQFVQDRGWIVRGLHYWAAQSLFVLAALQIVHGAFVASYRKPRELAWFLTLALLGLAVAEGITGGLLPWDQRGWWGRVVEGNIVGMAPGLGPWLQQMIQGGTELGALGLARGYTAHVLLLPALIALVLWGRRRLVRRHGWAAAEGTSPYARQLARNVVVGALV